MTDALDDELVYVTDVTYTDPNVGIMRGVVLAAVTSMAGSMGVFCSNAVRKTMTAGDEIRAMYLGSRVHVARILEAEDAAPPGSLSPNKKLLRITHRYERHLLACDIGAIKAPLTEQQMVAFVVATQEWIKATYVEMTHGYRELEAAAKQSTEASHGPQAQA